MSGSCLGLVSLLQATAQAMSRWEGCVVGSLMLPVHCVLSEQHCVPTISELVSTTVC